MVSKNFQIFFLVAKHFCLRPSCPACNAIGSRGRSQEGCWRAERSDTALTCHCTHLTLFAGLLQTIACANLAVFTQLRALLEDAAAAVTEGTSSGKVLGCLIVFQVFLAVF